jgi:hypothetical protein
VTQALAIRSQIALERIRQLKSDHQSFGLSHAAEFISSQELATFCLAHFEGGQSLVHEGRLSDSHQLPPSFNYAAVPLMLILSGSVSVVENGKAVKRKGIGEFIGDFEVAHRLYFDRSERVGTWSVFTDTDTDILFFDGTLVQGTAKRHDFARFLIDQTRRELIPTSISTLPLLNATVKRYSPGLLDQTLLVASTHLLPTNIALLRHLASLVGYGNVVVLEKAYSTVRSAYTNLIRMGIDVVPVLPATGMPYELAADRSIALTWNKVVRIVGERDIARIVIFDDGGMLLSSVPWERLQGVQVTGFEQTTSGLIRLRSSSSRPPIINVAGSPAKRDVEAKYIGRAIVDKIISLQLLSRSPSPRIGLIGLGAIGQAIAQSLQPDIRPLAYDGSLDGSASVSSAWQRVSSLDVLMQESDVIIGSSGTDALARVALERVRGHKILISASTSDTEFFSLLNIAGFPDTQFGTINVHVHRSLTCSILNGGFPINFDRQKEWEPLRDIQLTRSLLYLGFVQALGYGLPEGLDGLYDLDRTMHDELLAEYCQAKG